jgi:hypothetical protein
MATRSPGNIHDRTFHTASQVEKEVDKKVVVAVLLCHMLVKESLFRLGRSREKCSLPFSVRTLSESTR